MKNKDSIANTFKTAVILCLVCSLIVSATAIGLKSRQQQNIRLDKQKNILTVAGFSPEEVGEMKPADIEDIFAGNNPRISVEDTLVDLNTGQTVSLDELNAALDLKKDLDSVSDYDQDKLSKKESASSLIKGDVSIGSDRRENYSHVFVVTDKKKNRVSRYVFPVRGKGLWSTLKGYLAVDASFNRIEGITFYSHAETPGLGGEVDNPNWKKTWSGRLIYNSEGEIAKEYVVKGSPNSENRNAVAGLSGATITSKGVSNLVRFWLGNEGFGKYMEVQKQGQASPSVD